MQLTDQQRETIFENDVRRIARELWPQAEYGGALEIEGRERDGVFETEECIHLVESTVSRGQQKAKDDGRKLAELAKTLQPKNPQKAVKCWFVTREEPTADQRTILKDKYPSVIAISFSQLQGRLIDVGSYLSLRMHYPFGSVRDPANPSSHEEIEYVSLDLIESSTQALWSVSEIQKGVLEAKRFILFGDYGSGKSMTMREIFRGLRAAYLKDKIVKFPLYLNLRDHFGQTNPAEVLERHARNIGFANPSHLVRAWRAGYVVLLIDGFDELTTLGIQGLWKRLHEVRYRAMEVVRQFIKNQPNDSGLILAGRAHFFDSERERKNALHPTSAVIELALNEFNDAQIKRYLTKRGLVGIVPHWMPSRPLLVGYLAASGVLKEAFSDNNPAQEILATDPAKGWDYILDRVCEREADIEAGIDGPTVRRILERLATSARQSQGGLGPLSPENIASAFLEVCGYQPDEKGSLLLQRLPGLGIDRDEEGTRIFFSDEDFVDTCRAGNILRYLANPFDNTLDLFRGADCTVGLMGIGMILLKSSQVNLSSGKMIPAIRRALDVEEFSILVLDLVRISMEFDLDIDIPIKLNDVLVPFLELSAEIKNLSKLTFSECLFPLIAIDHGVTSINLPRFMGCYIDTLEGRSSVSDLPQGVFDKDCQFGRFSEAPETTTAIAAMDLPTGVRVLLAVLKKLFLQSGTGRKRMLFSEDLITTAEDSLGLFFDFYNRRNLSHRIREGGWK